MADANAEDHDFDDDGDVEYEIEEVVMEEEIARQASDENVAIDDNDLDADEFAAMDDDEFGDGEDAWGDEDGDAGGDDAWGDAHAVKSADPMAMSADSTVRKSVPGETKQAINRQVDEINMLPMFSGVPDLTAPAVMLGIKIKQFKGISRDQLAVWGLSEYAYIGVRLKFGRWFLHEVEPPTIEIGATNYVSDVGIDLQPFRIAWTLQDRCRNAFFCASDWHQNIKMHDIPNTSAINDLMETTQNTYAQCLDALRRNKNDVTKTTEELINKAAAQKNTNTNSWFRQQQQQQGNEVHDASIDLREAKRRFLRRLRKSSAKVDPMANNNTTESQKKKNWRSAAEKTSKTQRIRQLAEAFDLDYGVAKSAVKSLGYEIAAEQLADPSVRAQYVAQYQELHPQSQSQSSNSKKSKWWSFAAGGGKGGNKGGDPGDDHKDSDDDEDEDDEDGDYSGHGRYKLEHKVWTNLMKACGKIRNYENMNAGMHMHEFEDMKFELKFELEDDTVPKQKKKLSKSALKKKISAVQKLAKQMGLALNAHAIENAIETTDNGDANDVIDAALNNLKNPSGGAASGADHISGTENNGVDEAMEQEEDDDDNMRKRRLQKQKEAAARQQRMLALGPCPRLTKTASDSIIHEILSVEESMESVSRMFDHNFLLVIVCYILKQLLNSTDNCMICGQPLQYPGLKPTICMSPFCQFRLLEIGLGGGNDGGYGLGAEILGNSDICDFLICCACAAAGNPQRSTIFFPEAVRGASSDTADESFLDASGKPDVQKLQSVIALCPAIDSMKDWARQGEWSLKEELGKIHCLLYPYLIWVVTSNRAFIMKLEPTQIIQQIKTPHQFVMRSQTPERADIFNKKKQTNGSVFYAWHGSGIFNWHSILRMGLKNYSNTKFMSAGAAYGAGIYTAENSGTSLGYCTRGSGGMTWKGSKFGANVCCMALCEIVGPKKNWDKGNGIYVISDEASIATRYFFLFDSSNGMGSLTANSLTLPNLN